MYKNLKFYTFVSILIFSFLLFAKTTSSEYLNFVSPKDDVNFHIIRAIDGCKKSIDLTMADIKSSEIGQALISAHGKGIDIRILITRNHPLSAGSQLRNILESGIKAWALEEKDVYINNFAIFDKKLLLSGSYNLDNEKYQNITFTNDPNSVREFQSRFDGFANLKLSTADKLISQNYENSSRNESSAPVESNDAPVDMVNLSFEDMNRLFGKNSTLSGSEKKRLWKEYEGRTVTWTGNISYVAWGLMTGSIIGVLHQGNNEVTVQIRDGYVDHVKKMHKGDPVTYRGKLAKRPKRFTGFKIKDTEIVSR